ncbi:MAG TPA: magnesium transporter CorA family protein [Beijerinckiaceae bacterium]|jgi:magnesium transporter|nr:magnesium transporter CorA family protein [Beijerinckiaceae bacterium]
MLRLERLSHAGEIAVDLSADKLPANIGWIDLFNPTKEEIAYIERAAGLKVPGRDKLVEIESSSRLHIEDGALYLSMPTIFRQGDMVGRTPLGFLLTPKILVTVRFEELKAFADVRERLAAKDRDCSGPVGIFVSILEAIVDRTADVLEHVEAKLDEISDLIFREEAAPDRSQAPGRETVRLKGILRQVGRSGDMTSNIRDCLLGIGRIVPYVENHGNDWISSENKQRLAVVKQDVASLDDYKTHLTDKIQFLLDATLGLTNIDQNNIFRILTIVSVVGIPPTLIAGIYGMNFKIMPELNWEFGYPIGLAVIALSGIIPLIWFKVKGWF